MADNYDNGQNNDQNNNQGNNGVDPSLYQDPNANATPEPGSDPNAGASQNDYSQNQYNQNQYDQNQNQYGQNQYNQNQGGYQQGNYNQGGYNQNGYNQGGYNQQQYNPDNEPMEFKDWLLTLIISVIPCLGFIMLLVWAFSKTGNVNRRNFSRAYLIIQVIGAVIVMIVYAIAGAAAFSMYY